MKTTPKLQDTLEVFLQQIEELKISISEAKKLTPTLEQKIFEIKSLKVEPDLSTMSKLHNAYLMELSRTSGLVAQKMQEKINLFDSREKQNTQNLSNFYFYTVICFFLTAVAIFFSVKFYNGEKEMKKRFSIVDQQNSVFKEYITDTGQIEKYRKWVGKKEEKQPKK